MPGLIASSLNQELSSTFKRWKWNSEVSISIQRSGSSPILDTAAPSENVDALSDMPPVGKHRVRYSTRRFAR